MISILNKFKARFSPINDNYAETELDNLLKFRNFIDYLQNQAYALGQNTALRYTSLFDFLKVIAKCYCILATSQATWRCPECL